MLQILIPIAIGGFLLFKKNNEKTLENKLIVKDNFSKGLSKPSNMNYYNGIFKTMPQEIINYIYKNFDDIYGSPYSTSIYSKSGQSWDFTPKGQIRVSDHWNFFSRDYSDPNSEMKQHSITNTPVDNNTHWTVAKKENGIYKVILSLPKKESKTKIKSNTTDWLAIKNENSVLDEFKRKKSKEDFKKAMEARLKKLKNGKLYASFDRIYTERIGTGRNAKYNTVEENDNKVIIVKETNDFITVKYAPNTLSTYRYKKSTLRNYKEHKRKPKNFTNF